ncbi:hypothetical protein ABTX77_01760 [Streptomyces sp. NPDC097704]|uniref:tetratricopeptide repeat protein n=1 Tax=Streptomyces sp. NPDC097704 TaxID=3157101 RepID=UPI00332D9FE3
MDQGERPVTVDNGAGVVVIGDGNRVGMGMAPPVRSGYWEQVRSIAPTEIIERESELAELKAFCEDDSSPAYAWWRAEAWAGKTALLSWFALHPPSSVRVVPFFVTARLGAQNDVVAYVDVVLEQLAELVGEELPARLTDATRAGHLMRLYAEASRICKEHHKRLVLLVDGLDEDRGVTVGPDSHSIASLLPHAPDSNTRVIVAGRLNPPLPGDVPIGHSLRDPATVRILKPSPYAQVMRAEAERELKAFLSEGQHSRDLLGLVVASGGGLTADDLAHLTGTTAYAVKDSFRTRAGRTFAVRETGMAPASRRESYLLAHEELHTQAREMLGEPVLEGSRSLLRVWYEEHRESGWPPDSPEYLLKGYFQLLRTLGDTDGMVRCALDDARRERLLDVTGNDAAGLAELRAAGEAVAEGDDPWLRDMLRISIRRRALEGRTSRIPSFLPAAWVCVGAPHRGESLARGIPDREERALALIAVGAALAGQGDSAGADGAFAAAEEAVSQIRETAARRSATERLLRESLRSGRFAPALRITADYDGVPAWPSFLVEVVQRLTELRDATHQAAVVRALTHRQVPGVEEIVAAFAEMGDFPRAISMARSLETPTSRAVCLLRIASVARHGSSCDARLLIEEALSEPTYLFGDRIAQALVGAGEVEEAVARVTSLSRGGRRSSNLTAVIEALAEAGETHAVDSLLRLVPDGAQLSEAATVAAEWAAWHGHVDRGMRLARVIVDDTALSRALSAVAAAMVRQGETEDGLAIARMLAEQDRTVRPVIDIAVVLAETGEREQAHAVLAAAESGLRLRPSQTTVHEIAVIADALAKCGFPNEARSILEGCESQIVAAVETGHGTGEATVDVACDLASALANAGLFHWAETLASRSSGNPGSQDRMLVDIARSMVRHGEFEGAERVAGTHVKLSSGRLVAETALALATAGEWDRAMRVAERIMAPHHRPWLLSELSYLREKDGLREPAVELLASARDSAQRAPSTHAAAGLVRASVLIGDLETARLALGEAEALLDRGAPGKAALRDMVRALVALGEYDRAEALVGAVASPSAQAVAKADLVEAFLEHGRSARARAMADSMQNGRETARAYVALADKAAVTEARRLLALALHRGWWTQCLAEVLAAEPDAVSFVLEETERLREELA